MLSMSKLPPAPLEKDLATALIGGLAFIVGFMLVIRLRRAL